MNKLLMSVAAAALLASCAPQPDNSAEKARLEAIAQNVTITRDNWGIPHIKGTTDAEAVFGMVFAQAEDDFNRVELNYINAMGRLAEYEGESALYQDLRMKLFIDVDELKVMYEHSSADLQSLMTAWADGLNHYLYTHPEVTPKVITHFEPWMALSFTEGSIGGDIESISLALLENFYGRPDVLKVAEVESPFKEPQGSNGISIAPHLTANGNALFLINPHTSFYFRAEAHMQSDEGLNVYGAATWGQPFIYQGFSDKVGFMHTSSRADVIDEAYETIEERDGVLYYQYGDEWWQVKTKDITLPYKDGDKMSEKVITAYFTHRGPIVREADGKWISVQLMNKPIPALEQSWARGKSQGHAAYYEESRVKANSSNNTVYADSQGNIAYYHGNFHPVRDVRFDYTKPVDGANPDTDWKGLHPLEDQIIVVNPDNGWVMNTNNWPFSVSGKTSPKKEDFPVYMSNNRENYRGLHALRLLEGSNDWTLDKLVDAAYDSYLPAFEDLLPPLIAAWDGLPTGHPLKMRMNEQIEVLREWDYRFGEGSVATSLAVFWGQEMLRQTRDAATHDGVDIFDYIKNHTSAEQKLGALEAASNKLTVDFLRWQTPWGEINRFQRLTGDIVQPFDDSQPSHPVGFTSATWGSLAAYGQRTFNNTKRIYGTRGNSFVAVVEFGEKIKAKAIMAGGQSGSVNSPHFADQAELYAQGKLRDVYFYDEDIKANAEETYIPGKRGVK